MIFAWDEEQNHAGVLGAVAGIAFCTDAPLAADLERDITRAAVADIGERDDGDLATCFLPHLRDDGFHVLERRGVEHAGEVIDVAARRWHGDLEEDGEKNQRFTESRRGSLRLTSNICP